MKKLAFIFLALCTSSALNSQSVSFNQAAGSPITNASNQRGLTSRDINGDGNIDLIVANLYSQTVRVLLGNGNGQFTDAPGSPISVVTGPNHIAIADFNGDTKLDIATANYNSNNVTILLGTGTGSFTISSTISTGLYPYCIDVADFNMDGNIDLVTCNVNSNDIHILLGNGSGGFTAFGSPLAAGGMPYHVVTGYINADAFPDFIAANGQGNSVGVYFGNGSGGFNTPVMYTTGSQPRTITLKDLNNDGYKDMTIANALSNNITVLMGSQTGTFSSASGSPFSSGGTYPYQCAVADFNSDGKMDIATGNCFSDALAVLLGNGNGTFNAASGNTLNLASGPQPVVTEDFNGDSKPDLAIGHWYDNTLIILLNSNTTSPCNLLSSFTYTLGSNGQVNFSNTSSGTVSATSYTWDFGDLGTSINFQPSHTYGLSGTYTVSLTASNNSTPSCVSTSTQVISITLPAPCSLLASFNHSIGTNGNVSFINTSSGTISTTSYFWDFGDLSNSTVTNPTHTYINGGTYSVKLFANNNVTPSCSDSVLGIVSIELIPVGISEFDSSKNFQAFPNPTHGFISIQVSDSNSDSEMILFNSQGQEKLRIKMKDQNDIDISTLESGIYLYRIIQNGELIYTSRLILLAE